MTQKVNGAAYPGVWVEKQVTFVKLTFNTDISALAAANLLVLGTATPAGAGTVADSTFAVVESAIVQALKTLELKSTFLCISTYGTLSYASAAGATSSGTLVTVGSVTGIVVGQTVTVTAGVGAFAAGTTVLSINSPTTFTVSATPTTPLSGGASVVTGSGASVDVMLGFAEGWFSDANGIIATAQPIINAQAIVTTAGAAPTNVVGALVSVSPTAITFSMEFVAFNGTMPVATFANGALDLVADGATPGSAATPMGASGYYPSELAAA
jgi:hypothetical protein